MNRATTVGFVGTGHIAQSMITGWRLGGGGPDRIIVSPRNQTIAADLAKRYADVVIARDNQDVLDQAQTVILSVRPQIAEQVLTELTFAADHRVISLIATFSAERLAPSLAPATILTRAVPMPFVAQRRGPLAVYPPLDWAMTLLEPLGDVIATPSEAAFDRFCAISATMSSFFLWQGALNDWLVTGGVAPDLAARYVSSQIHALSLVPIELESEIDFAALAKTFATKGGINEQVAATLTAAGVFDQMQASLDQILRRIQGA